MKVASFRIRASYPNYYMVNLYAKEGMEIFNHDSEDPENQLEGNKPGTVIYRLKGDEDNVQEFPPRWYDMYQLLKLRGDEQRQFLELLLSERFGTISPEEKAALDDNRSAFRQQCIHIFRFIHELICFKRLRRLFRIFRFIHIRFRIIFIFENVSKRLTSVLRHFHDFFRISTTPSVIRR